MSEKKGITPQEHRKQIEAYTAEFPHYATYAVVLKRILERAGAVSIPEAFVQARPKSVSSFAEKCVRRYATYPDAVNQMTDLCGARVIVQTLEQVQAVRLFIEANFEIHESDEKGTMLGEDKFGYRDMHYIVSLHRDTWKSLGITEEEKHEIGQRRAEVQVRTWLQHAWADTLHDRMYKNPLRLSREMKRTGNLLAALMEEGDRNYNSMVHELDGMIANYAAFATRTEVDNEIAVQRLILGNEPSEAKRPGLALKLGRLLAACGDFAGVAATLEPYDQVRDANRCELVQDLGHAICKTHRKSPKSDDYKRGLQYLQSALSMCACKDVPFVPHLRKRESLHARAMARLAWALEVVPRQEQQAREYWHRAHEHEPANPYYLSGMLGFEVYMTRDLGIAPVMRATILEAIKSCRVHAEDGIELPYAYFTAGRLSLLLDQPAEALGYYARGIRYCLAATHCFPADIRDVESDWISRLFIVKNRPASFQWALDLFELASSEQSAGGKSMTGTLKAMIVAGGAKSITTEHLKWIRPLVETALEPFAGTVIAGGTTVGVPGCVGDVAAELDVCKKKLFRLIGYRPHNLPHDAPEDTRYELKECGQSGFTPEQLLQYWRDLFAQGILGPEVLCLGFGGGPVAWVEYCLAVALGATVVAIPAGSGDAADTLLGDPLWNGLPNLLPLLPDPATVRALVVPPDRQFDTKTLDFMATSFHETYVDASVGRLPENMKPWPDLQETFRQANREQARYAVCILEACGFAVRKAKKPVIFDEFKPAEIERMSEMEHGRWNAERLRKGWRPGKPRDDARMIHDCLVPWSKLDEKIKRYDREAVRAFPRILAKAGLEIYRPSARPASG